MRRMRMIGLSFVAVLAITAMAPNADAANTKPLNLYEGEGFSRRLLVPGERLVMDTFNATTLVTPDGYVECAGETERDVLVNDEFVEELGPYDEISGILGTNGELTDTVRLTNASGVGANRCKTSLDLGKALIFFRTLDTLSLSGTGAVEVAPPSENWKVVASFEGGAECVFESADARGKMIVASTPVPTAISFSGARFKRNAAESSPICPKTARLYAGFHMVNERGERIYDSN